VEEGFLGELAFLSPPLPKPYFRKPRPFAGTARLPRVVQKWRGRTTFLLFLLFSRMGEKKKEKGLLLPRAGDDGVAGGAFPFPPSPLSLEEDKRIEMDTKPCEKRKTEMLSFFFPFSRYRRVRGEPGEK